MSKVNTRARFQIDFEQENALRELATLKNSTYNREIDEIVQELIDNNWPDVQSRIGAVRDRVAAEPENPEAPEPLTQEESNRFDESMRAFQPEDADSENV